MAYGLKYYGEFSTELVGSDARVEILEDGYMGSSTGLKLSGFDPIIITASEKEKFDVIRPTGAFINIFQEQDQAFEFMDLFNGSDRQYRVLVYNDSKLYFHGYVMPELFNQELTPRATTVQIPCADGLGFLDAVNMQDLIDGNSASGLTLSDSATRFDGKMYQVKQVVWHILREFADKPLIRFYSKDRFRDFGDGNPAIRDLMNVYLDEDMFSRLTAKEFIEKMFLGYRLTQGYHGFNFDPNEGGDGTTVWNLFSYDNLYGDSFNDIEDNVSLNGIHGYDGETDSIYNTSYTPIYIKSVYDGGTLERNSGVREVKLKCDLQEFESLVDIDSMDPNNLTPISQQDSTILSNWPQKPEAGKAFAANEYTQILNNGDGTYRVYMSSSNTNSRASIHFAMKRVEYFNEDVPDKIRIRVEYELPESFITKLSNSRPIITSRLNIIDRTGSTPQYIQYSSFSQEWLGVSSIGNQQQDHQIDWERALFDQEERRFTHEVAVNLKDLAEDGVLSSGDSVNWQIGLAPLYFGDGGTTSGDSLVTQYDIRAIDVSYEGEQDVDDEVTRINDDFDRRVLAYDILPLSQKTNTYANNLQYYYNGVRRALGQDWLTEDTDLGYQDIEDVIISDIEEYTNDSKIILRCSVHEVWVLDKSDSFDTIFTDDFTPANTVIEDVVNGSPTRYSIEGYEWNVKRAKIQFLLSEIKPVTRKCTLYIPKQRIVRNVERRDRDSRVDRVYRDRSDAGGRAGGRVSRGVTGVNFSRSVSTRTKGVVVDGDTITINAKGSKDELEYSIDNSTWQSSNLFTSVANGTYTVYAREKNRISCVATQDNVVVNYFGDCALIILSISISPASSGESDGSLTVNVDLERGAVEFSLDNSNWQLSNTFKALASGDYTVYVREVSDTSCTAQKNVTVSELGAPPLSLSIDSITTVNATNYTTSDGEATINASGTDANTRYRVDGGSAQVSNSFSGLKAGNHVAEVFDSTDPTINASDSFAIKVEEKCDLIGPLVGISTYPTDSNPSGGEIFVYVAGSQTVEYRINSGSWQSSNTFSGLAVGLYNVQARYVADTSCSVSSTLNLQQAPDEIDPEI